MAYKWHISTGSYAGAMADYWIEFLIFISFSQSSIFCIFAYSRTQRQGINGQFVYSETC